MKHRAQGSAHGSWPLVTTLLAVLFLSACDLTGKEPRDDSGDDDPGREGCMENNPAAFRGAVERCNGWDDNCDGIIDEDAVDKVYFHLDQDGDGYGDPKKSILDCFRPPGYVADGTDCDDNVASTHPGATERVDDGKDQDCDGMEACQEDLDGDGHGSSNTVDSPDFDCSSPGESTSDGDCDDADPSINPDAAEIAADGIDQDCDGKELCWYDADRDDFGGLTGVTSTDSSCDHSSTSWTSDDCDDSRSSAYPGAPELCNELDDDCDGVVDNDPSDSVPLYLDTDGDGYGAGPETGVGCDGAPGYSAENSDCDDSNPLVSPAATERCNGIDDDCNGAVDDASVWYEDTDADGYGASDVIVTCAGVGDASSTGGDCDDTNPDAHPGAIESCGDGADNDCDGTREGCLTPGTFAVSTAAAVVDSYSDYPSFGQAVDAGRDIDGDGVTDLLVGVPGVYEGRAYLLQGPLWGDHDSSDSLAWFTGPDSYGLAGQAVCFPGDINADGREDILIGGPSSEGLAPLSGVAWLHTGPFEGGIALSSASVRILGEDSSGQLGATLKGRMDLNDDGYTDIAIGAPWSDLGDKNNGAVGLYWGPLAGTYTLHEADVLLAGTVDGQYAATSIGAAGDVNGDGVHDLLVGAPGLREVDHFAGGACLFLGPISGYRDLVTADATLLGEQEKDCAGTAVDIVGDLNADGYDDLAVAAPYADIGYSISGTISVIHGPVEGSASLSLADAFIYGEYRMDLAGTSLKGAGDIDADGFDDLLIGAPGYSANGEAYLIDGPIEGTLTLGHSDTIIEGDSRNRIGISLAADDQPGPYGRSMVVFGAPGLRSYSGEVYIFYGWGL